jgi:hypothetical protein
MICVQCAPAEQNICHSIKIHPYICRIENFFVQCNKTTIDISVLKDKLHLNIMSGGKTKALNAKVANDLSTPVLSYL